MQQELVMDVRDYVKMLRERVSHITGQPLGAVGLDGKYAGSGNNGTLSLELSKNASLEQGERESATVGLGLRMERLVEELRERTRLKKLNLDTVKNRRIIGMSQKGEPEETVGEGPIEEGQTANLESVWDQHFSNGAHKVRDLASPDQKRGNSPGAGAQKDLGEEVSHEKQLEEDVKPEPRRDRDQAPNKEGELDPKPHDGSRSGDVSTEEPRVSAEGDPEKSGVDSVEVAQQEKMQIQPPPPSWSPGSPKSPIDGQLRIPQMAQELGHRLFATHFASASNRGVGKEQDDLSSKHDHPGEKASVAEAKLQTNDTEKYENMETTESPLKPTGYSGEHHVPGEVAGRHREGVLDFPSGMKPEEDQIEASIPEAKSDESAHERKGVGEGAQREENLLKHPCAPSKSSSGSPNGHSRPARPLERSHHEARGDQSKLEEREEQEQAQAQTQESTLKSAEHTGKPGPTKNIDEDLAEDEGHLDAQGDQDVQAGSDTHVPEPCYDERERESLDETTRSDDSTFAVEELDVAGHADQDKRRTHERYPRRLEVLDSEQGGNVGLGISTAGDNSKPQQVKDGREVQASKDLQATRPLHETQGEGQLEMLHFKQQGDEELSALQGHEDKEHPDLAEDLSIEAHFKDKAQVDLEVDLEVERGIPDSNVLKDEQQHADTTFTGAGALKGLSDLERLKKQNLATDLEVFAGKISADDPRRGATEPEFTSVLKSSAVTADASENRAEVTGDVQSNRRLAALHEENSQNSEDEGHRETIAPQEQKISANDVGKGIGNYEYHQDNEHVTKWLRTLQHGSVATPHLVKRKEQKEEDSRHEAVLSEGTELKNSDDTGVLNPKEGRESMPCRQSEESNELVQDLVKSESPQERLSELLQLSGGVKGPSGTGIQESDAKHESATLGPHAGLESEEKLPKENLVRNEQPKKRLRSRWHRSAQAREREDQNATRPSEGGSSRHILIRLPHFLRDKSGESGEVVARENDNHERRRPHLPHFPRLGRTLRLPGDKNDKEDPERTREAVVANTASSSINREKQRTAEKDETGLASGFRKRFRRIRQMMALTSSDDESDEVEDDSENTGGGQQLMRKVRKSKDGANDSISVDEELEPKEVFDLEIRVDMGGMGGKEEEIGVGEEVTGSRRVNNGCVSFIVPQGWTARRLNEGFALSKERAVGFIWAVDGTAVHRILLQTERLALPSTVHIAASPVFISKSVICVEYHCHYYAARAIARFEDSESKGAVLVSLAIPAKDGGRRALAKMEHLLMRSICILEDPPMIDAGGNSLRKVEQVHSASYIDNTKCTVQ